MPRFNLPFGRSILPLSVDLYDGLLHLSKGGEFLSYTSSHADRNSYVSCNCVTLNRLRK